MIDYSVIIRTTGEAHEKYQKLLDSIEKLMPQPQEIIVVLPEGKEYPKEKTGKERYYFSSSFSLYKKFNASRGVMLSTSTSFKRFSLLSLFSVKSMES